MKELFVVRRRACCETTVWQPAEIERVQALVDTTREEMVMVEEHPIMLRYLVEVLRYLLGPVRWPRQQGGTGLMVTLLRTNTATQRVGSLFGGLMKLGGRLERSVLPCFRIRKFAATFNDVLVPNSRETELKTPRSHNSSTSWWYGPCVLRFSPSEEFSGLVRRKYVRLN